MQILAIVNQKGGVGKTTTAASLAVLMARRGAHIHLIDMDPQASLTSTFGYVDQEGLLYQAISERQPLPIVPLVDRITITPSNEALSVLQTQLHSEPGREYALKDSLENTQFPDDAIVIIDSPPSLDVLSLNCLTAAQKLIVAVQPGGYELKALGRLRDTVNKIRHRLNPSLEILGAILTNCRTQRAITQQVHEQLARVYPVLGLVRSDAELLYATTDGTIANLRRSNAFDDYDGVVNKLEEIIPWRQRELAA